MEFVEFIATLIIPDTHPLRSLYARPLPFYMRPMSLVRHSRICDFPDFRIAERTSYPRRHFAWWNEPRPGETLNATLRRQEIFATRCISWRKIVLGAKSTIYSPSYWTFQETVRVIITN